MIRPPEENWADPEVLADWIELNAVRAGFVARGDVDGHCKDSSLWETGERASEVAKTSYAQAVTDAWISLETRSRALNGSWPFELEPSIITYRESPVYTALLCLDLLRNYAHDARAADNSIRTLFEHVVAASIGTLLGGQTCRFGAPFPKGWPSGFPKRVTQLARSFGLRSREAEIRKLSSKHQQDDGLDVLGRLKLGDEDPGTLYVLVQCATGANWKEKLGEPSIAKWEKYIDWDATLVRALAIPWAVRPRSDLFKMSLDFDGAIVLDRWRLVAGIRDETLAADHRHRLDQWVRRQIKALAEG